MKKIIGFGCLGVVAIFVFLAVIAIIFGNLESDDTKENAKSENEGEKVLKQEKVEITPIGENLRVGNVVFTVNEVATSKNISAAKGYMSYKPEAEGAEFLIINVSVKNDGKESITTDASFFSLTDGSAKYTPSSIFLTDEKFFSYDGINPGLTKKGNILFEIPEGKSNLVLNVQTGFWGSEQGQISIN